MKTRTQVVLLLILLGVGVVALWHLLQSEEGTKPTVVEEPPTLPTEGRPDDSEVERPSPKWRPRDPNQPPSHLDDLRSPHTTPENDVRLLALLFSDYASVFKRVPLGMHQEIVAALRGDNPRSIEYIPEGHPAVNANNEITDRWNKPFFFHVISRNAVEIISAGPDRELFTDDDIRDVPPHATVEPNLSMTLGTDRP